MGIIKLTKFFNEYIAYLNNNPKPHTQINSEICYIDYTANLVITTTNISKKYFHSSCINQNQFPNTIYDVIIQKGQFTGFNPDGEYYISDSIREAVKYYFEHENEYGTFNSWRGDGTTNHFYYQ